MQPSASLGDPNNPKTWKGPWVTITQPTDIAKTICEMNDTQYDQAFTMPFGSGPLATALGRNSDTATALSLLKGVLPPSLSETARLLQTLVKASITDSSLTHLHSSMMSLPFKHGFAPPAGHVLWILCSQRNQEMLVTTVSALSPASKVILITLKRYLWDAG
jgi:hypothetical protein